MINLKKVSSKKTFIVTAIMLLVFTGTVLFTTGCGKKTVNKEDEAVLEGSFFWYDSNNKYALFNSDGKKLTDFIFTSKESFINGTAIVKQDDKYGIINEKGKMIVDFGTYKYIKRAGGLYEVTNDEYDSFLLDNQGKVLYDLDKYSLNKYTEIDTFSILKEKETKKYIVINYEGKEITSFDEEKDSKDPRVSGKDKYGVIYYGGENYIIDTDKKSVITKFSDDSGYCIKDVMDDDSIILNACSAWYESNVKVAYKVVKKNKLYDIDSTCEGILIKDNILYCRVNGDDYVLDSNYKKLYNSKNVAFDSKLNYIKNHSESTVKDSVDFYDSKNNVVQNVKCRKLVETDYSKNGIFVLGTYYSTECGTSDGRYEYYNASGKKLFDKDFDEANLFDNQGNAIVKEDTIHYYLMNEKGKQLTDTYTKIVKLDDYYKVTNSDKNVGIVDKNGKVVLPCEYKDIVLDTRYGRTYASYTKDNETYTLYSIDDKKVIFEAKSSGHISTDNGNFCYSENGIRRCYLYKNGKKFYESEK